MKYYLILGTVALLSFSAFAESDSFRVLLREPHSYKTRYAQVKLPHLESNSSFDGSYFKIVKGKSNEAISFDEKDEGLRTKAATVYYHLSEARKFWVHQIKSEKAASLPKLTVRLEITNQFNELGHFAHDNKTPQYNNALSVPGGETPSWVPAERQDKWEKEIWFRPKKVVLTKDLGPLGPNPLTVSLMAMERPLINYVENQVNHRIMREFFYPAYTNRPLHEDLIRYAGTYALMKLVIYGSRYTDNLFIDKYYYLDTAMVPEIASHEYAHIILSDHLEMSHSTPVNEGMADYFAAVQSKKRKVYGKVAGFSNNAPKDTQEKRLYSHWDESHRYATSDFTLSVLWDVRETLGEEIGDRVVYQARKYLNTTTSTISHGLLTAILRACEEICEVPRRDKIKLYETFGRKGF